MKQFQIVNEYPYAGIANQISGVSRIASLGTNPGIDTAAVPADIWSGAALGVLNGIDHKLLQFPTSAVAMEIVSSSASDTAAGAGLRTALVIYLDSTGTQKTTTVTLNGTTPVALPENILFVQFVRGASSGTVGGNNIGNVSIRDAGGLGKTYSYMTAGTGFARSSGVRVPAGNTLDLLDILSSLNRSNSDRWATWSLCQQDSSGLLVKSVEVSVSTTVPYVHRTGGGIPIVSIPAGNVVWVRAENVSGNSTVMTAGLIGLFRS